MIEADIQEFYAEAGIIPLTIVYEDFINKYEKTIWNILEFLEVDSVQVNIGLHITLAWLMKYQIGGQSNSEMSCRKIGKTKVGSKSRLTMRPN